MAKRREYVTPDETVVATMVDRIVEAFDPERIVLFGSVARGEVTKYSDVDLLVVMPDGTDQYEAVVKRGLRWLRYAREDLALARALMEERHPVPRHPCWLSQQAAEKAIKAALVFTDGEAPLVHDLEALLNLLSEDWPKEIGAADLEALTPWASDARYPGDRPKPTAENAAHSVVEAQKVYGAIAGEFARRGMTGD